MLPQPAIRVGRPAGVERPVGALEHVAEERRHGGDYSQPELGRLSFERSLSRGMNPGGPEGPGLAPHIDGLWKPMEFSLWAQIVRTTPEPPEA